LTRFIVFFRVFWFLLRFCSLICLYFSVYKAACKEMLSFGIINGERLAGGGGGWLGEVDKGGAAGAEGFYMPEENIAAAFVKNRLSPKHPDHPVRDRISMALEIPTRFW
jgi:CubicO group peptidase (beta-lactamase class C family)